jgi:hypothetical protein
MQVNTVQDRQSLYRNWSVYPIEPPKIIPHLFPRLSVQSEPLQAALLQTS